MTSAEKFKALWATFIKSVNDADLTDDDMSIVRFETSDVRDVDTKLRTVKLEVVFRDP